MLKCILDYETRSRANLELVGAIEYAKDPTTSIFCLGYKIGSALPQIWIPEKEPMPDDLWRCFKYAILIGHNASFERAITTYTLIRYPSLTREQRRFLARIKISRWRCTAAKAAASSLPRKLELASRVLELPTQKDMEGHKLIKKYCKPRKPSKKNPKHWWDNKADLKRIYAYCKVDCQAEYELDEALPDLTPYEQKIWELDQKTNDRGVLLDIPTVKIILTMIGEEVGNITRDVKKLSGGTIDAVTQRARVLEWVNERGAEMPNLTAPIIKDKLEEDDLDPNVRLMLKYRQWGSKSSTAKYVKMIKAVGVDHRARELLLYCGAFVTGRWSGKRIQPQNFPRPTIKNFNSDEAIKLIKSGGIKAIRKRYGKENVMDVLVSAIRGMIIASPGFELFCADFSAVEARLAFWVAEHEAGLRAYRENRKLYEEMACDIFGMEMHEVLKDSLERFVAKESILGCQYGMGWLKFMNQCHKKGMKSVTAQIAKKAVYTYRDTHSPVADYWRLIEQACVKAIQNPGMVYKVTKVKVYKRGRFLNIVLPSGRRIRYFKPRIGQKQLASGRMVPQIHHWAFVNHQWIETVTWGGILFANIVSGIARDLMANAMLKIDEANYKFLLSVHDEGLSERRKGYGDLKDYVRLMTSIPAWAKGAPITAEGWNGLRYRK